MKNIFYKKMGYTFLVMCLFSSTAVLTTSCEKDEEHVEVKPEQEEFPGQNDESNNNQTAPIAEAVDLGLSVKWASHNVGASKPEDYGGYYAWGETEEKTNYTEDTYQYYQNGSYVHIGDNICGTKYDVAHVKWGGSWRMPSKEEMKELDEKCSWEWTSYNGTNGYIVTGPNGNSIFRPAAGYRGGTVLYVAGADANFWSGSLNEYDEELAYYLRRIGGGDYGVWSDCCLRYYGLSVRPVSD